MIVRFCEHDSKTFVRLLQEDRPNFEGIPFVIVLKSLAADFDSYLNRSVSRPSKPFHIIP
jgi:hypothetical protein